MTRLAVDIGNTSTSFGMIAGGGVTAVGDVPTKSLVDEEEASCAVTDLFGRAGIDRETMERAVIASVVPAATAPLAGVLRRFTGAEPLEISPALHLGIRLEVDEPDELGADRIANAVGAYHLHGGPVMVVDFGTATTIEVVNKSGAFLGGAIFAGVFTAADALAARGAKLSRPSIEWPDEAIGRSTAGAIRSGMLWGSVAQIDGLLRFMAGEIGGGGGPTVIATGGIAPLVAPHSERIDEVDLLLTLKGLMWIEANNR